MSVESTFLFVYLSERSLRIKDDFQGYNRNGSRPKWPLISFRPLTFFGPQEAWSQSTVKNWKWWKQNIFFSLKSRYFSKWSRFSNYKRVNLGSFRSNLRNSKKPDY